MSVKIYDSTIGAFKDAQTPLIWDGQAEAWKESTGMVWNEAVQAWEEVWGMITAYVYGAAKETITIKQNGITVCQVSTDSTGQSTEQIRLAGGTYELTGSVSGWTETQLVNHGTERFRAMPKGAIYWYGNKCEWLTGGITITKNGSYSSGSFTSNYIRFSCEQSANGVFLNFLTSIDLSKFTKITTYGYYEQCTYGWYENISIRINGSWISGYLNGAVNKYNTASVDISKNTSIINAMEFYVYALQANMYSIILEYL